MMRGADRAVLSGGGSDGDRSGQALFVLLSEGRECKERLVPELGGVAYILRVMDQRGYCQAFCVHSMNDTVLHSAQRLVLS